MPRGVRAPRRVPGDGLHGRARCRRHIQGSCRGTRQGAVARASESRSTRSDIGRPGTVSDDAATHRHAPPSRSCRAHGGGTRGLRPPITRVPPLLDAGRVRAEFRTNAGHRRAGHSCTPQRGPHRRVALLDGAVAARLGHGGADPVRLVDDDQPLPPGFGQDGVRQQVGPTGSGRGGAADPRNPRAEHAQPAQAIDDYSAGEPGQSVRPVHLCCAGAGPRATVAAARVCDLRRQCPERGRPRCRPIVAGVLVRSALLRQPLRGGDHRRASRDVGCRVLLD